MFGAIIGDLAGSVYEYEQIKTHKSIEMHEVIEDNSFISDDSILTCAVADAMLNKKDFGKTLREYVLDYEKFLPNFSPYFSTTFSPNLIKWAKTDQIGSSCGNGAMMRISPVGFLSSTEQEVLQNTRLATTPSHNSEEAIKNASIIALIIFYSKNGLSKQEIISKMNLKITKPKIEKFNYTCKDTIDVCLYSFFNSDSFEDCIRTSLSFGGDTDTNACIVGSMAEAYYGIDEDLKNKAKAKLPDSLKQIVEQFYNKLNNTKNQMENEL